MGSESYVGNFLPYYYQSETGQHLIVEQVEEGVKVCVSEDVDGACIVVPFAEINRVLGLS